MGPGELPPDATIQFQVIGVTAVPLAGPVGTRSLQTSGAGGRSQSAAGSPEGHPNPVEEGREGWRWQGNRDREGPLQVSRR